MASTGRELEKWGEHNPETVDPEEEPSVGWGWHGGFRRGSVLAGWLVVAILIALNFSNNNDEGATGNIYLSALAFLVALGLLLHWRHQRRSWRR